MSKNISWILVIFVITVVGYWLYVDKGEEKIESMIIQLSAQNGSGQNGQAELTEIDGKVKVILSAPVLADSNNQPAHIHTGSCAVLGGVKYPLTNLKDGSSETVIDVSLSDLLSQGDLAINLHKSPAEAGVYTACGDLK